MGEDVVERNLIIGELVLHLAAWTGEAARRLSEGVARDPEGGDWPPFEGGDDAWLAALQRLEAAHADLLAAVADLPPERLGEIPTEDPHGVPHRVLLHGLAQHHAYHGGQIALLNRALNG